MTVQGRNMQWQAMLFFAGLGFVSLFVLSAVHQYIQSLPIPDYVEFHWLLIPSVILGVFTTVALFFMSAAIFCLSGKQVQEYYEEINGKEENDKED